jgi:hypothetical protein
MVSLLDLAMARVPLHQVGGKEWHGPCPFCGTSQSDPRLADRFWVNTTSERYFCRQCSPKGGDAVMFLRQSEGKSCPEAHAVLGKECDFTSCPVWDKCSQGKGGEASPRQRQPQKPLEAPAFVPAAPIAPLGSWKEQAAKLIDRAHEALLASPEQLDYLAQRGLPLAAVQCYRFGWLSEDNYRARAAWGLPEILRESDRKPKKLFLPQGIVIPFFASDGTPDRLQIRRSKIKESEPRYYWVPGSSDDIPVLGPESRAFAVVESNLDAFLIHHHAGDLVGAIPMGTCSAKPKAAAHAVLTKALCVLVSLDYEPRENASTGKHENPGGKSSLWWVGDGQKIKPAYPRAKRWPTPVGKDPGEAFTAGVDIREWILKGLPPIFHIPAPVQTQGAHAGAPLPDQTPPADGRGGPMCPPALDPTPTTDHLAAAGNMIPPYHGGCQRRKRPNGILCLVADDPRDLAAYAQEFPDHAIFCIDEMKHLQGLDPVAIDAIIASRLALPGSEILETKPHTGPDPAAGARPPVGARHAVPVPIPAPSAPNAHQQELTL